MKTKAVRSSHPILIRTVILILTIIVTSCNGVDLQKDGIPTSGTVIGKRDVYRKKNGTDYFIKVNFFTQPDAENPEPKPKSDSPKTVDEIIEGLTLDVKFGDYQTAEIEVDGRTYNKLSEGDKVPLRYEKNNPSNVVLEQ
jgi:hypothetical protein